MKNNNLFIILLILIMVLFILTGCTIGKVESKEIVKEVYIDVNDESEENKDTSYDNGNKNNDNNNENNKLNEIDNNIFTICIDPGHQDTPDKSEELIAPGATKTKIKAKLGAKGIVTGKTEYELNLEASFILKEILESQGIKVIMTRTTHNVNLSNKDRAEIANKTNSDLLIRVHADQNRNKTLKGASILTPSKESTYTKDIFEKSKLCSELIFKRLKENEKIDVTKIVYRSDIVGFNWSKVPVMLVEMGYMSNPEEDKKLSNPNYLKMLVEELANGLLDYKKAVESN